MCLESIDHWNPACLGWLQPYLSIVRNMLKQPWTREEQLGRLGRQHQHHWKAGKRAWVSHWQNWMDLAEQRAEGAGARYSSAECSWAFTPSFDSVIQFNGWERRNSLDSHTLDRSITFPGMGRFFSHYQSGICSLENRLPIMALYRSFAPQTEYPCQRTQDQSTRACRPTPAGLSVEQRFQMLAWVQEGTSWLKAWHCLLRPCFMDQGSSNTVLGET